MPLAGEQEFEDHGQKYGRSAECCVHGNIDTSDRGHANHLIMTGESSVHLELALRIKSSAIECKGKLLNSWFTSVITVRQKWSLTM